MAGSEKAVWRALHLQTTPIRHILSALPPIPISEAELLGISLTQMRTGRKGGREPSLHATLLQEEITLDYPADPCYTVDMKQESECDEYD